MLYCQLLRSFILLNCYLKGPRAFFFCLCLHRDYFNDDFFRPFVSFIDSARAISCSMRKGPISANGRSWLMMFWVITKLPALPFSLIALGETGMNVTHFANAVDVSHKADNGVWSYFDVNEIFLASPKGSIRDDNGIIRISRRERFFHRY